MKTIIIAAILMLFSVGIHSQQIQIKGEIRDAGDSQPVEFANIVLQTLDSAFIAGTNSNEKGAFRLEKIKPGDYRLVVSYLGYETTYVSILGIAKSIDLGKVLLQPSSVALEEVTIKASAVRSYSDRRIAFPTDQQKQNATNGINLLSTMMLPRLQVNPLTNEVKADEGDIQFCINGIKVEALDVQALSPKEIIRVEYHDNPGVRYGNVAAVLDYIVKREMTGGSVNMNLSNSPVTVFGDDQVAVRLNHKKSEFGLQYSTRYRNFNARKEALETYNFGDGMNMQRVLNGIPTYIMETTHNTSLNYSLVEADKYYFNATLRYSFTKERKKSHSLLYEKRTPEQITDVRSGGESRSHLPSLDLYYMRTLKNKQTITANIVGTYINTDANQNYTEKEEEEVLSDVLSNVLGKKYSLIGEGIYEKNWDFGRLSSGVKHSQAWTDNTYAGTVGGNTRMKQSETYLFAEFSGKVKRLNYMGGVGIARSWFKQEGEDSYQYYSFRPKVSLQYNMTDNTFIRLGGSVGNTSPALSELSAIEQIIDTLQIRRGNPYLTPYINYNTYLNYEYKKGLFTGGINLYYWYSPDMIMEETLFENNKFIRTYANQNSWQKVSGDLNVRFGPIKNILMFNITGGVNHFISDGRTYRHTYTNLYYTASVMAMYKKFMGMFQIGSPRNNFVGETMHGGENIHLFMLRYNQGKFTAGAGIMLPFSSLYKREDENRNRYAPYKMESFSTSASRMLLLTFSWNFEFGRKYKGGNKRLNNMDTDAGIVKGDK
ncbi:TonB-dependent receptor [Parabacteroides acidifaciens]|uniref:TonB-dependent receptor n=1 Tax=Parabacteroides acidifaciens TaxID=2290935 RepID=A0A3D8HFU4_9BACT|nr:TonB-dependent receptor [Parabacteroides acidifaciens]MBC8601526.1 TonB-dependent receptor [Parabacteroides acidifaciens]RDU49845.1 TonB-dependent receptor [Parabacteroides acidifaciens]